MVNCRHEETSQKAQGRHQSLRGTPAMEAGLTDHVWTLEEIVALIGKD